MKNNNLALRQLPFAETNSVRIITMAVSSLALAASFGCGFSMEKSDHEDLASTGQALKSDGDCQAAADIYGLSARFGALSHGFAPQEVQDWWSANHCFTGPVTSSEPVDLCQKASEVFGMRPGDVGYAPPEVAMFWEDHQCKTSPLTSKDLCQRASDTYGIVAGSTFGLAPQYVQTWWRNSDCNKRPVSRTICRELARPSCQGASDMYGISPSSDGFAPQETRAWWHAHGCQTTPNSTNLCQMASERYGIIANETWGFAPPEVQRWWQNEGDCINNPKRPLFEDSACQVASDRFGTIAGVDWGCATDEVQSWWSAPDRGNCRTSPVPFNPGVAGLSSVGPKAWTSTNEASLGDYDLGVDNGWECVLSGAQGIWSKGGFVGGVPTFLGVHRGTDTGAEWLLTARSGTERNANGSITYYKNPVKGQATCFSHEDIEPVHLSSGTWKAGHDPARIADITGNQQACFLRILQGNDTYWTSSDESVEVKKHTTTDSKHMRPGWYIDSDLVFTSGDSGPEFEAVCWDFKANVQIVTGSAVGGKTTSITTSMTKDRLGSSLSKACGLTGIQGAFNGSPNDGVYMTRPESPQGDWDITVSAHKVARYTCAGL